MNPDTSSYVGKVGTFTPFRLPGLRVNVRVLDARSKFGRVDLLVSPVAGTGAEWVQSKNVTLDQ